LIAQKGKKFFLHLAFEIKAYQDDFYFLVAITLAHFLERRQFFYTGFAPGGPKVDNQGSIASLTDTRL
jgi:hypothetical protein